MLKGRGIIPALLLAIWLLGVSPVYAEGSPPLQVYYAGPEGGVCGRPHSGPRLPPGLRPRAG